MTSPTEPSDSTGSDDTLVQPRRSTTGERALELPGEVTRFGHYVLLEKLGQGGMGVVYAAFDTKLDRKVAIKLLRSPDGEDSRLRMIREAQAMARVSHPNVVQVYEIGEHEHLTFLVMEFVEGVTLGEWLAERPRTQRAIVETLIAAGRGLAAAHQQRLIHRDFKPENVMIRRDGRVLVMDFGLARQHHSELAGAASLAHTPILELELTHAGTLLGTPMYMTPEQFIGRETDARTDQFSFCVVLWEALHGQRPFQGATFAKLSAAVIDGRITTPKHANVPNWLRRVLERGLARDPAQRWPSMLELLDALARDPSRRRRGLLFGVGLIALAGLLIGGVTAWRAHQRSTIIAECERAGQAIAADWNEAVAAELEQAFRATGLGYAASAWTHTRTWMDDYAQRWSHLRTQTCLEYELEHTRAQASHDAIVECLDVQRTTFAGLLAAWADVDSQTVSNATAAAAGLLPVSTCTNELLAGRMRAPESVRDEVAAERSKLDRVRALRLAGEFEQGLARAQEVVAAAERLSWRPLQAEALLTLATLQSHLGNYELARDARLQAYQHALAGGDDRNLLLAAIDLTHTVGYELAQYERGSQWGKIGELLIERLNLAGSLQEAALWTALGGVQIAAGKYEVALDHLQRALSSKEAELGPMHPQVAQSLDSVAVALINLGKHAEAIECLQRALTIYEAALGPEHPAIANSINNLAAALGLQGNTEEALALLHRALAIREAAFGPEHPDVGATLSNIGVMLHQQGYHALGLEHQRRALEILEAALGPSHPDVALTYASIGGLHHEAGEWDEAIENYRRALALREAVLGSNHYEVGTSHYDIGRALLAKGDHELAIASLEQALAIREAALGSDHANVGRILAAIGQAQIGLGKREAARESLTRALTIGELQGDAELSTAAREQVGRLDVLSRPNPR